jgi:hypothetical protein
MLGNLGDPPAGIQQADHFQPVAGAGLDPRRASAALQLGALLFGKMDAIQRVSLHLEYT